MLFYIDIFLLFLHEYVMCVEQTNCVCVLELMYLGINMKKS